MPRKKEEFVANVGARIRELRERLDMSKSVFGRVIGVSASTLCGWESDKATVPKLRRMQICKAFNVNQNWLELGVGSIFKFNFVKHSATDEELTVFDQFDTARKFAAHLSQEMKYALYKVLEEDLG